MRCYRTNIAVGINAISRHSSFCKIRFEERFGLQAALAGKPLPEMRREDNENARAIVDCSLYHKSLV